MVKISIMYPYSEDKKFDMDYYFQKHMPGAKAMLKDTLKKIEAVKGYSGFEPGSTPAFVAIGDLYFDSVKELYDSLSPVAQEIQKDILNFTDIVPVFQISDVQI